MLYEFASRLLEFGCESVVLKFCKLKTSAVTDVDDEDNDNICATLVYASSTHLCKMSMRDSVP